MRRTPLAFFIALAVVPAFASTPATSAQVWLSKELKGKTKILRDFPCGTVITFDAQAKPKTAITTGPWTLCGEVKVEHVNVIKGKLHLAGERQIVVFKGKYGQAQKLLGSDEQVVIEADLPIADVSHLQPMLASIFISPSELPATVPPVWKSYFANDGAVQDFRKEVDDTGDISPSFDQDALPPLQGTQPFRLSATLAEHLLLHREMPHYPAEARSVGGEGSAVLEAVIDGAGKLSQLRVVKPLGAGLDEAAADAIANWTYRPLIVNGQARRFITYVRVNFRLKPSFTLPSASGMN